MTVHKIQAHCNRLSWIIACSQDRRLNELRQVPVLPVQTGIASAPYQSIVSLDLLDPLCNCSGAPF